ncbi:flagellar motor switch protein FliG [Phyllobacterium endophyticum]|uniref:Flagellar motor switch protein FliG n=1 Tax=Phyllobacterium endophyticum TaxID=1149773 RepID=A0A2P7ANZ4_9HYPH|nr:flagellar motor switch protein FliG [Phyllobacterium endophyticum]MBB3233733.1 flagellar motor switch protein FliG [Phyllobacterium endophyticum]PSH55924.1 flagellar motor switch protein FliG [Phyllobacterium endophyticum]TYR41067.1 flagellar motor switch protein FliG [Phyllobacterium endophyticum]
MSDQETTQSSSAIMDLSGPEKVAALLVAIGRPSASRLLKHFTADDLRSLAGHARKLEPITPGDFEELVKQFENAFADGAPVSEAGMRFEGLLRETLSADEASAVIENRRPELLTQESVWDQLPRIPPDVLHVYLNAQHPQVGAYVISRLPSDVAAKLLIRFGPAERTAIIQRTLHIRKVDPAVSAMLEGILQREVTGRDNSKSEKSHHGTVANIINQLEKSEIDELLAGLSDLGADDLAKIKAKLFTFEDIVRISQRARLVLFDEIQTDVVTTALLGCEPQLQELILQSLSTRGRRMVETELSNQTNINANAVTEARRAIARTAIMLADRGDLKLAAEEPSV